MKRMFDKHNPPWNVILYVLGVAAVSFLLASGTIGCNPSMPPIDVTIWAGDSANAGVTRKQDSQTIVATDPRFDEMACMTYVDVRKIYSTLLTCKDWGEQPKMTRAQAKALLEKHKGLITHVASQDHP